MEATEGAWRLGTGIYGLCINPMPSPSYPRVQDPSGLVTSTCITFAPVKRFIHSFIENLVRASSDAMLSGKKQSAPASEPSEGDRL